MMGDRSASERLRIGVMGAGWVATARHIPAFKRDGRATLAAVLDPDPARAASAAKQSRIPLSTSSLEEFLAGPLDAVTICAPPADHGHLVQAALEAGKHVLVEKPMTMTADEGRRLDTLAGDSGLVLCPAHNFLFSRSMRRAEALLERGEAGDVHWAMGFQMSSWRRRLPTWFDGLPGGLFFDEAPHLLYLMRRFLGEVTVESAWRTEEAPRMERTEARLRGTRGGGHLTLWFGAPSSEWLFVLFCSKAVLVLDLFRDLLIKLPAERAHRSRDVMEAASRGTVQLWQGVFNSGLRFLGGRLLYGHELLVSRFVDAVVTGGPPPVSARDGWEVVGLMEEILRRSSKGAA